MSRKFLGDSSEKRIGGEAIPYRPIGMICDDFSDALIFQWRVDGESALPMVWWVGNDSVRWRGIISLLRFLAVWTGWILASPGENDWTSSLL